MVDTEIAGPRVPLGGCPPSGVTHPSIRSSNVIREADHFRVRRMNSISATMPASVAVGWCFGVLDRSCSPRSPYLR